jgi:thiosulfate reductase cytochrome b subunit
MTGSSPWINYSGPAEIVLVAALLLAAAALAFAGFRLRLPARPRKPGKAAAAIMITAWVLSIVALLVSTSVYIAKAQAAGFDGSKQTDSIAPITLIGVVVVFVVIAVAVWRVRGPNVAVGSALIGALAAPWFFEVPFDLIISTRVATGRVYDPDFYLPLLFGVLILVGLTTIALLSLSSAMRVHRATLWCLAGMLVLFAVWGLFGFGYPSAPVPFTFNALSKILALATPLTLFLPQPARSRKPEPAAAGSEQSELTEAACAGNGPAE